MGLHDYKKERGSSHGLEYRSRLMFGRGQIAQMGPQRSGRTGEVRESARSQERVSTTVPVKLEGGAKGVTRDVSPTGIFFETDEDMSNSSVIHFTLEFDNPSGKLLLKCRAEIVRVEKGNGKIGVAAKIIESQLERVGR